MVVLPGLVLDEGEVVQMSLGHLQRRVQMWGAQKMKKGFVAFLPLMAVWTASAKSWSSYMQPFCCVCEQSGVLFLPCAGRSVPHKSTTGVRSQRPAVICQKSFAWWK